MTRRRIWHQAGMPGCVRHMKIALGVDSNPSTHLRLPRRYWRASADGHSPTPSRWSLLGLDPRAWASTARAKPYTGRSPLVISLCMRRRPWLAKPSRRCMVQRLSQMTRSPTCHFWVQANSSRVA